MRNLLNPKWILLVNVLPIVLTLLAYHSAYGLIVTELEPEQVSTWQRFGAVLAGLGFLQLAYALFLILTKRLAHLYYGLGVVLIYVIYIYTYWSYADRLIPIGLPEWVLPPNTWFYLTIALMPGIVHGLLTLVTGLTLKIDSTKAWHNLIYAGLIPLAWYVFFQLILPLWQQSESDFEEHVLIISVVISTLIFLFFIIRSSYLIATKRKEALSKWALFWKIPLAIVFPLAGLALNNGLIGTLGSPEYPVFGDFTSPWYYVLALMNGILYCLPPLGKPKLQLALFFFRGIGFTYISYFFLVFLPYSPISLIAIILLGLGFLMLTPVALMITQTMSLIREYEGLKAFYRPGLLRAVFMAGVLVIPLTILWQYQQDRKALHRAMAYVFEDHSHQEAISVSGLDRVLDHLESHKRGSALFARKPILSPIYNSMVLDNLTLSAHKINRLRQVFFDEPLPRTQRNRWIELMNRRNEEVQILATEVDSEFDEQAGHWVSQVTLKIKNHDMGQGMNEFVTHFELPDGAWITDYYLWMGDRKEPGILAEKKTATWLYQQITSRRRDPGILYYLTGNKVGFRVFPFLHGEVRTTGFELIHKEAFELQIDEHLLSLGKPEAQVTQRSPIAAGNALYFSRQFKSTLPLKERTPYLHFLLDCSEGNDERTLQYEEQIRQLMRESQLDLKQIKVSTVNAFAETYDGQTDWEEALNETDFEGGFFLEKAMKQLLVEHYENGSDRYPVFVVLTEDMGTAVLTNDLSDYQSAFPENDQFYVLKQDNRIRQHSLTHNPKNRLKGIPRITFESTMVQYWTDGTGHTYYLADNDLPAIVHRKGASVEKQKEGLEKWEQGLHWQGAWQAFNFGSPDPQQSWLNLVKGSFQSGIMNPTTSFLALETETQKELLRRKQATVLNGQQSLDLGENPQQMSEPGLLILVAFLALVMYIKHKRSRSAQAN